MRCAASAIAAVLVMLVTACTGTETGNPSLRSQMGFAGKSSMPLLVGFPGMGAPVVVTELHAHVASVDFNEDGECPAGAGMVELTGVGAVDLLAAEGNIRELDLRQAAYCAATVQLSAAPMEGVPADLAGRSLALRGRRRSDAADFVWSTPDPITVVMPSIGSLFLVDPEHLDHVVTLDVAVLFGGVDIEAAVVAADMVAHLDAPENAALGTAMRESVGPATALHRDPDGDGLHDDGEASVVQGGH